MKALVIKGLALNTVTKFMMIREHLSITAKDAIILAKHAPARTLINVQLVVLITRVALFSIEYPILENVYAAQILLIQMVCVYKDAHLTWQVKATTYAIHNAHQILFLS